MIPWWALVIFVFGANSTLWGSVGLVRLADRYFHRLRTALAASFNPTGKHAARIRAAQRGESVDVVVALRGGGHRDRARHLTVKDVAVLIAAHNESVVIEDSLEAIIKLVPKENIHVVSDGSTDNTEELAAAVGVNVMATGTNLGKAGALSQAIKEFDLVERFAVVMLLDGDTRVQPAYFTSALPLFDDLDVSAVAGAVGTAWDRKLSAIGTLLVGHRTRIYSMAQRVLKFGQTWSRINATYIVPGFASMYRTDVLPEIDMNPPGLVIEDFNMTFELYQKRLGKVGFSLGAVAVTQDPDTFRDYVRQTKRWALGLWQTVRRHPPRFNLFSGMLAILLIELVTSSLIFLLLPILVVVLVLPDLYGGALSLPVFGALHALIAAHVDLRDLLFGIVAPDYALTLLVAGVERKPRLLLGGLFFMFLRVFDAGIALYTLPSAWLTKSNGRWQSPARRALSADGIENSEQSHAFVRGAKAG